MIVSSTHILQFWMIIVAALLGYHALKSGRYFALTAYFLCLVFHNTLSLLITFAGLPISEFVVQPFRSLNTILMFFAVKELLFSDFRYTPKVLIHLILPLTVFCLIAFGNLNSSQLMPFIAAFSLPYILANYLTIHRFNKLWSTIQSQDTHPIARWLKYYLHFYSFMITIEIYRSWFGTESLVSYHSLLLLTTCALLTVLICQLLTRANFLPTIDQEDVDRVLSNDTSIEDKPSRHYQDEYPHVKQQLIDLMTNQRPYLNPNITLKELAELLSVPSRALSEHINECYECNFSDFINRARVEEAKQLIESGNMQNQSLFHVALDSGFNSKSSFNVMFKRHTGVTPSSYRREFINSLSDQPQH